MPNLVLNGGDGQFTWKITNLGSEFKSSNYESAGITKYTFTQASSSISGIVDSVNATSTGTGYSTPERTVTGYAAGTYTFYAWCLAQNGTYYPAGSAEVTVNAVVTSYKLTLDKQSGSGGTSSVTVWTGERVPDISTPSRSGYVFKGYFTQTGGKGVKYYDEDGNGLIIWSGTTNGTLYAYWEKSSYTITLDKQSGSGGTNSVTVETGKYVPDISIPSRSGYVFKGYFTQANGLGVKYYDSSGNGLVVWSATTNITVYAYWVKTYTLTLDKQSGSGGTSSVTIVPKETLPNISVPTRTNYKFSGYFTQANGLGVKYYNADGTGYRTWDESYNGTLYAYWERVSYTITLDKQSGSGGTSSVTVETGKYVPDISIPSRDGYTFMGYFTQTGGAGVKYYDKDGNGLVEWSATYDATLFAYWIKAYTITFDKQNGSGGANSVTVEAGKYVPDISIPSRSGYTFMGYFTQTGGKGVQYYDSSGNGLVEWSGTTSITVFAYWISNTSFKWTNEKVKGVEWNLTKEEWDRLATFVNNKRTNKFTFTTIIQHKTVFTAAIYNEMVSAIGKGTTVSSGQIITADLMNELVTNANAM